MSQSLATSDKIDISPHSGITKTIVIAAGRGMRLGDVTKETPKCLLQVGDKTILDHQRAAFAKNGLNELVLIKGHEAEKIDIPDTRSYLNTDYANNNILLSLMYAKSELDSGCVVSYSDIIYGPYTVQTLLETPGDIVGVVDVDWRGKYEGRDQHPESEAEKAAVDKATGNILALGKQLNPIDFGNDIVIGEFIGLFKLTETGAKTFRDSFVDAQKTYAGKPFYHAASFEKSYITDLMNHLIANGVPVQATCIERGWLEIDTPQDLERARHWITEEGLK